MNNRILYIDYAKAIVIIFVIMAHVNFANGDIKAWITSFAMPAFFFCAGLVFRVREPFSLKDTLRGKIHRLMIPYFLWALFYAKFSIPNFMKILYGSSVTIAGSGTLTSLWFLPVMFVALCFFYLFVKTGQANSLVLKIILMIIALVLGSLMPQVKIGYPWGVNVAITSFAFLLLGNFCQAYFEKMIMYFKAHHSKGIIISFLLFLFMFACTLSYRLNTIPGGWVNMKSARYGDFPLFVLTAICGTFMVLSFCMMLELLNKSGYKFLSFVGQNTLVIFVVHKPIIHCFSAVFWHFSVPDTVALAITTIVTLLISCFLCKIINKCAPILAGRQC